VLLATVWVVPWLLAALLGSAWIAVAAVVLAVGYRRAARIVLLPGRRVRVITAAGLPRSFALDVVDRCEYREFWRIRGGAPSRLPRLTLVLRRGPPLSIDLLARIPDEPAFRVAFPNPYTKERRP
jgi:hypothetical protein